MIKLYSTFEGNEHKPTRIYTNDKNEYAEIFHVENFYGVYKCDKYGFKISEIRFVGTFKEAKAMLEYFI